MDGAVNILGYGVLVTPSPPATRQGLLQIYRRLLRRHGHARWWPGETPFEVCIGAILTQNTAWVNVKRALASLRVRGLLSYEGLRPLAPARLAPLIRSSGTYRVKARRVAAFLRFLDAYDGRVEELSRESPAELRRKLLSVSGIGPETADCIALYVGGKPLFVVDAYTRRLFGRLGMLTGRESYEAVQRVFMERLPADAALFGDYHAQIVRLAKDVCRPRPQCGGCALHDLCPKLGVVEAKA